jgi:hypothetical protein
MAINNFEHCHHILEDGIHHFTIFDFSRAGADDFINAIDAMHRSPDAGLPLLVDSSRGAMPLGYVVGRLRDLYRVTPREQQPSKVAVIVKPSLLGSMMDGMMRMFMFTRVRQFTIAERDAALDWLRQK